MYLRNLLGKCANFIHWIMDRHINISEKINETFDNRYT